MVAFRYRPWPGVVDFLKDIELGSIVLDVGCGNGKYAFCNSNIVWIGVDRSQNLMKHNIQHLALHTKQESTLKRKLLNIN
jgi:ubiquinone/menaquinone biosynthesis C-methylase UbiE